MLLSLHNDHALTVLLDLIDESSVSTKIKIASEIIYRNGNDGILRLGSLLEIPEVMAEVKEYESIMSEE